MTRPSRPLVARLERIEAAFLEQSLRRHANVDIARAGRAGFSAICGKEPARRFKNMTLGLEGGEEAALEEAFARYRGAGIPATVELAPVDGFEALFARACDLGARPVSTGVALIYDAREAPTGRAGEPVTVREIAPGEAPLFAATLLAGHAAPEADVPAVARWADEPGVRLYVAEIEGAVAGAAALFEHDGVGYLANASTLRAQRGRGVQTALILRRIADALRSGAELCSSVATFASTSHANLERAGMRVAYARHVLTE